MGRERGQWRSITCGPAPSTCGASASVCLCIHLFVGQLCIRCYVHFQCKGTVGGEQGARATSVLNRVILSVFVQRVGLHL